MLNTLEMQALIKSIAGAVRKHVSEAIDNFSQRIDRLEKSIAELPTPKNGEPGKSVTVEDVTPLLHNLVAEKFETIPVPKDGEPGKSVTVEDVTPLLHNLVAEKFETIPVPKDGEPGKSVTVEDITPLLHNLVAEKFETIPVPKDGQDGKSVMVEDITPLLHNLVAEKFETIPVPKDGQDGKSVTVEDVQRMVDDAVAKAVSALHIKNGEPGRDAAHIEILPCINDEKSYPRGTFATHSGGLFRSYETTHGMKGWECIVDGIAEINFQKTAERKFNLQVVRSSGDSEQKEISLPVMLYRGVFASGGYEPGDTVTWAGSLWHCDDLTSDKPGEANSKGWTLCAKKGRDGKDGINGRDLVKGVSIK